MIKQESQQAVFLHNESDIETTWHQTCQ